MTSPTCTFLPWVRIEYERTLTLPWRTSPLHRSSDLVPATALFSSVQEGHLRGTARHVGGPVRRARARDDRRVCLMPLSERLRSPPRCSNSLAHEMIRVFTGR